MKNWSILSVSLMISTGLFSQEWAPEITEVWEPVPLIVTPGEGTSAPSDAIVLFDGKDVDQWETVEGDPVKWTVENGILTMVKSSGDIRTKQGFGDIQLHVEWRAPAEVVGDGQGRGNSGIFLQGQYEVQVLDSYENSTYSNGQAGSVYKPHIPLVNACRPPGEWQAYDIVFIAPRFNEDGTLFSPAVLTVLHNGLLIQNHVTLKGATLSRGRPSYKSHDLKQPIMLQDHRNPVSYRNIWVREL